MEIKPNLEKSPELQRRRRRRRSSSSSTSHGPLIANENGAVHSSAEEEDRSNEEVEENAPEAHELEGPAWHGLVFTLVPLVVILFGAGRDTWSKALAGLLMGGVMLFFPARRRLPGFVLLGLVAACAAPLLAFLPKSIHSGMPWRDTLQSEWGINTGNSITPQPWVTLEAWLVFCVYLLWLGWCLARGFSSAQRRTMLNTVAIGGIFLTWLAIVEKMKLVTVPWWPVDTSMLGDRFGPFVNRNHLSSLAAFTCVFCAAAAYDAQRRKSRMWIFYAAGFFVPATSIYMNSSRAGFLLLFLGITFWLGVASMRSGFFKKMALNGSIVLIGVAALFVANGGLSSRMKGAVGDYSAGLRAEIYKETLLISSAAPWIGNGLGNFDAVYALSVPTMDPRFRVIHPESDLLWVLMEGGLSTLVPCLLLIYWVSRSTGPWFGKKSKGSSHRHDQRTRNTACIALFMGLFHGVIDTPLHGLAYFSLIALFAGMALRPRRLPVAAGWQDKAVSFAAGVGIIVLAGVWAAVAFGKPVLPGNSSATMLRDRSRSLASSGSAVDALDHLSRAIALRPLDYGLYYERAQTRVRLQQDVEATLLDFTRARVLEPHFGYMCYHEGVHWLYMRPEYAVIGWREFLKRFPSAGPGVHGYYRQMIQHAQLYPELRQQLWSLASTLELKLDFLSTVNTKEDFEICLRDILARQPDLSGLDSKQRASLFELWERLGDHDALMAAIASNKTWQKDGGWKLLAEDHAKQSNFAKACEIASIYMPSLHRATPGSSTDIQAMERAFLFNALDPSLGIDLFQAYKDRKNYDSAIKTLDKVRIANSPPAYIDLEIAALYLSKEDYRRAWEHYRTAAAAQK